jgi:hypothetical protein
MQTSMIMTTMVSTNPTQQLTSIASHTSTAFTSAMSSSTFINTNSLMTSVVNSTMQTQTEQSTTGSTDRTSMPSISMTSMQTSQVMTSPSRANTTSNSTDNIDPTRITSTIQPMNQTSVNMNYTLVSDLLLVKQSFLLVFIEFLRVYRIVFTSRFSSHESQECNMR